LATRHIFVDPKIRKLVSRPLGEVIGEDEAVRRARSCSALVIAVGDIVSLTLLRRGVSPNIVVFDERTRREGWRPLPPELLAGYHQSQVENPAGTIGDVALRELKKLISLPRKSALKILGEEDLLGLPAIQMAPVGSLVLYGQPDTGIVAVAVNPETKAVARSILEMSRVSRDGHGDS